MMENAESNNKVEFIMYNRSDRFSELIQRLN